MLQCLSGANFVHNVGDVVDFPAGQAARLIAAGIAEAATKDKAEKATKAAPAEKRGLFGRKKKA